MGIVKTQNMRRNEDGTDWYLIHEETSADMVLMGDGMTNAEERITAMETKIINENRKLRIGGLI